MLLNNLIDGPLGIGAPTGWSVTPDPARALQPGPGQQAGAWPGRTHLHRRVTE